MVHLIASGSEEFEEVSFDDMTAEERDKYIVIAGQDMYWRVV